MQPEKNAQFGWFSRYRRILLTLALIGIPVAFVTAVAVSQPRPQAAVSDDDGLDDDNVVSRFGEIPGEFENHEAILVCWPNTRDQPQLPAELKADAFSTNLQLIRLLQDRMKVVALVQNEIERTRVIGEIKRLGLNESRIRVVSVPLSSCWIRDFGPISMRDTKTTWISSEFALDGDSRRLDKLSADAIIDRFQLPRVRVPLFIDGGNLLSNGNGLVVATSRLVALNAERLGYSPSQINRILREFFGAKQVVVLDTLEVEPTGHADMFMTFTAKDTVVVGEYRNDQDPVNREILDRNAARLRDVRVEGKPLKVVRIPMPPRGQLFFGGSYTNVVFANGLLIVPVFGKTDPAGIKQALAIYGKLLPGWKIVTVEASAWLHFHGSLHCLTKNLYRLPKSTTATVAATP